MTRIFALLIGILCSPTAFSSAQETVTISKSRLEELERKEAELEKLKGSSPTPHATLPPSAPAIDRQNAVAEKPAQSNQAPVPVARSDTPSLTSLPPLEKDSIVSSAELAAHYRMDAGAADARYRKRTFKVQGEIVGFEKPAMIRNYHILLRTAEPQIRIICDFYPPEEFKSVYTINAGTALVGVLPGTRVPIAKIGDAVVIEGRCKGLSGGGVKLTDCKLNAAK